MQATASCSMAQATLITSADVTGDAVIDVARQNIIVSRKRFSPPVLQPRYMHARHGSRWVVSMKIFFATERMWTLASDCNWPATSACTYPPLLPGTMGLL